jgi:stearoyl-CoA desaturase (delta-9 desaturase)
LARTARWEELQSRLHEARSHAEAFLTELHLPHVPSVDEIRRYAEQHLARTPSLEDIAARARQILLESISVRLLAKAAAPA